MVSQISADFEQMLENIHTLVKSIEAAGVGTRGTQMAGLRTLTTSTYLDSASGYAAGLERMIADLTADTAAFRDALQAVVAQKQESEESLSSSLAQISQIVDDPALTSTTQLQGAGTVSPDVAPDTTQDDDGSAGHSY